MPLRPDCRRETLAESPVGCVELCSCGSVHIGLGPAMLRVDAGVFLAFAAMIDEARARLATHRGSRPLIVGRPAAGDA